MHAPLDWLQVAYVAANAQQSSLLLTSQLEEATPEGSKIQTYDISDVDKIDPFASAQSRDLFLQPTKEETHQKEL